MATEETPMEGKRSRKEEAEGGKRERRNGRIKAEAEWGGRGKRNT